MCVESEGYARRRSNARTLSLWKPFFVHFNQNIFSPLPCIIINTYNIIELNIMPTDVIVTAMIHPQWVISLVIVPRTFVSSRSICTKLKVILTLSVDICNLANPRDISAANNRCCRSHVRLVPWLPSNRNLGESIWDFSCNRQKRVSDLWKKKKRKGGNEKRSRVVRANVNGHFSERSKIAQIEDIEKANIEPIRDICIFVCKVSIIYRTRCTVKITQNVNILYTFVKPPPPLSLSLSLSLSARHRSSLH